MITLSLTPKAALRLAQLIEQSPVSVLVPECVDVAADFKQVHTDLVAGLRADAEAQAASGVPA